MKAVLCFVVLSFGAVVPDMAGECLMAGFYLELGCTPLPSDDNAKCPSAFSCPDLHPDPTKCYYRGVAYDDRKPIPQGVILSSCTEACSCSVAGTPNVDCASVDCVETFDSDERQQCIRTFELDSCCSTGNVCGKDDIAKLKTCEVDGKTYYEGQEIEPKNIGKTCICTSNWDGIMDNTTCRDINCGLELHYQGEIMDKCAPVFFRDRLCPIEFKCPTSTSKVIRGLNIRNNVGECTFGNETLRVGDEVSINDNCMECKCKIPPLVSCSSKNDCSGPQPSEGSTKL